MLHIVICEDDHSHRTKMESIVVKYIETEDVEMELILSASGPDEVLDYLEKHPDRRGLYFLDVDLQHEINGIKLGAKIRESAPSAKIVFITTHEELAYLTFKHKIEALDYIVKGRPDDIETRMIECVIEAYKRYMQEKDAEPKFFLVNTGSETANIPHEDILFFETHPQIRKRMLLHMEKGKIDFRGMISEIEKLVPDFYRCHKSFIVNPNKIVRLDKAKKKAELMNGQLVFVAAEKMSELAGMIGER